MSLNVFLILLVVTFCVSLIYCAVIKSDNLNKNLENLVDKDNQELLVNRTTYNAGIRETKKLPENQASKPEARKKKGKGDFMMSMMPMMMIPFMMQTAIIPMMLMMLKMMLIKSAFIGKMAILIGLLNMVRRLNNDGGVYTHNVQLQQHDMHQKLSEGYYGYGGGTEYGAYINKKTKIKFQMIIDVKIMFLMTISFNSIFYL